jgi:glycosyltransferase involved in cell wall biosynthesis
MRILYCNKYNFPFSGTEVYLFELMEMMRARGHEVALFSMAGLRGEPSPYDQHLVPNIDFKAEKQNIFEHVVQAGHAIYSTEARSKLRGMIADFKPDIAHVRNIYHHLSPSIFWELKSHDIPVVYHLNDFKLLCPTYNMVSHGKACDKCKNGKFWHVLNEGCYKGPIGSTVVLAAEAYLHKWLRTYETCIDCFLAPSEFVRQQLIENRWDAGRIKVLPHFQKLPLQITSPGLHSPILYFGRLSPEKGIEDLLRAMQQLPNVRLRIAGEGPQRIDLEVLKDKLLLHNVEFIGQLAGRTLEEEITSSQFTVLPSRAYETLGKTILESYALGRAVVASDLGSRRELVQAGDTGLLYRPGDVNDLVEKLSFLSERPGLASIMGAAGRDLVERHYRPEDHYERMLAIYEQLIFQKKSLVRFAAMSLKGRSLRVAFIGGRGVGSKYSGIESYYEEAGKQLVDLGHEVTVYCRTYFTAKMRTYEGMRVIRLPTIRTKHMETAVHTLLSTLHASFSDFDIVHFHALGPALFSFIPRLFGKKTIVTVQGLDGQRTKWGKLAKSVLRMGERAAIGFPDATMVVSRTLRQHYRAQYGVETRFVPNGTHIRERLPAQYLPKWGLEKDKYILYLGRFAREKNCQLLVDAYKRLDTPVKLVFAGGSSYSDPYARELRKHESSSIIFLDWLSGEALDELLTNAMLFALPSEVEGLSLALLDAMSAGVCVLTSDIPENTEVVEGAGYTFRSGDPNDLQRMLQRLMFDPKLRETSSHAAQLRIRESYLWPNIAQQIEEVYRSVTEKSMAEKFKKSVTTEHKEFKDAA